MNVLGLDVSSNKTGYAYLEGDKLVDYGSFATVGEGLAKLYDYEAKLDAILRAHPDVDWVLLEDVYETNVRTTKVLSRYAGVTMLLAGRAYGIPAMYNKRDFDNFAKLKRGCKADLRKGIYIVGAFEALSAVGIKPPKDRELKKEAAINWCNTMFDLELAPEEDDAADAIILALAGRTKIRKVPRAQQ